MFLLKEVNVERIPPDSVIEYFDIHPDRIEFGLIELLFHKVQEFMSRYDGLSRKELNEDSFILINVISDKIKYRLLNELRYGIIERGKFSKLLPSKFLKKLDEDLNFLKEHDILEEINHKNLNYLMLKTNIQVTTVCPEYMQKLIPKDFKPVVANSYYPGSLLKNETIIPATIKSEDLNEKSEVIGVQKPELVTPDLKNEKEGK